MRKVSFCALSCIEPRNLVFFIHFLARFSSGEGGGASSPRRARDASQSTAILDISAYSVPWRDQARSEM